MITKLSFIHFRSTRKLMKKSRWICMDLRHILKDESEDEKDYDIFFEEGDEKDVEKALDDIFTDEEKTEKLIRKIKLYQTEVIYDEVAEEKDEEKITGKLLRDEDLKKLDSTLQNKIMILKNIMGHISNKFQETMHAVTVENIDVEHFREHVTKYIDFWPSSQIAVHIKREITDERQEENEVEDLEDDFDKEVKEFIKLIENPQENENKIHELVDKIIDEANKLEKDLDDELPLIKHVLHLINIIHIRFLHKIYDETPEKFIKLSKEGFSAEKLKKFSEKQKELVDEIGKQMHHIYKMGRYLQHKSN